MATRLMTMTTNIGRKLTIPVTNWQQKERRDDGFTHVDWSAEPDIAAWVAMLAPRLALLAPDRSISQVYYDLGSLANGDKDAWLVAQECYNAPRETTIVIRYATTEATRLLALHLWLDEVGA